MSARVSVFSIRLFLFVFLLLAGLTLTAVFAGINGILLYVVLLLLALALSSKRFRTVLVRAVSPRRKSANRRWIIPLLLAVVLFVPLLPTQRSDISPATTYQMTVVETGSSLVTMVTGQVRETFVFGSVTFTDFPGKAITYGVPTYTTGTSAVTGYSTSSFSGVLLQTLMPSLPSYLPTILVMFAVLFAISSVFLFPAMSARLGQVQLRRILRRQSSKSYRSGWVELVQLRLPKIVDGAYLLAMDVVAVVILSILIFLRPFSVSIGAMIGLLVSIPIAIRRTRHVRNRSFAPTYERPSSSVYPFQNAPSCKRCGKPLTWVWTYHKEGWYCMKDKMFLE